MMYSISLHKISITAFYGLYESEQTNLNHFEVDVDVKFDIGTGISFLDYTLIHKAVKNVFAHPPSPQTLEQLVEHIHADVRELSGNSVIRVAVRKLKPPMEGEVAYAQVCYEA